MAMLNDSNNSIDTASNWCFVVDDELGRCRASLVFARAACPAGPIHQPSILHCMLHVCAGHERHCYG